MRASPMGCMGAMKFEGSAFARERAPARHLRGTGVNGPLGSAELVEDATRRADRFQGDGRRLRIGDETRVGVRGTDETLHRIELALGPS